MSCTPQVEPYLMSLDKSNPSYHSAPSLNGFGYKGYIVDLLREVARTLNIDFTLFMVPDSQYGHQDYKGRWNGLIGELIGKVRASNVLVNALEPCSDGGHTVVVFCIFREPTLRLLRSMPQNLAPM